MIAPACESTTAGEELLLVLSPVTFHKPCFEVSLASIAILLPWCVRLAAAYLDRLPKYYCLQALSIRGTWRKAYSLVLAWNEIQANTRIC
jgi:hypothetical protein